VIALDGCDPVTLALSQDFHSRSWPAGSSMDPPLRLTKHPRPGQGPAGPACRGERPERAENLRPARAAEGRLWRASRIGSPDGSPSKARGAARISKPLGTSTWGLHGS